MFFFVIKTIQIEYLRHKGLYLIFICINIRKNQQHFHLNPTLLVMDTTRKPSRITTNTEKNLNQQRWFLKIYFKNACRLTLRTCPADKVNHEIQNIDCTTWMGIPNKFSSFQLFSNNHMKLNVHVMTKFTKRKWVYKLEWHVNLKVALLANSVSNKCCGYENLTWTLGCVLRTKAGS